MAALNDAVVSAGSKTGIRGIVGSAGAVIVAALFARLGRTLVVMLPDREKAIYFYNDLQVLGLEQATLFFPRSARLAYEVEKTENANVAMRAEVLHLLRERKAPSLVVTHPEAIAEKVITQTDLRAVTFEITVGNDLDFDFVDEWMHTYGFTKVDYVYEPGHYAIRGGILDIFSFSFDHPYRIEMSGSTVESIRKFEAQTQLSVAQMKRATVVPDVTHRQSGESRVTLLEYLGNELAVWVADTALILKQAEAELDRARQQFAKLGNTLLRHDEPEVLFAGELALRQQLEGLRVIEAGAGPKFVTGAAFSFQMEPQPSFNKNFDMLGINLANHHKQGFTNIVAAGQPKQIERLYQIFQDKDHEVNFEPLAVELSEGFIDKENKVLVYTDHQLFERYHRFRLKEGFSKSKEAMTLKELVALKPGDYVVHIDHGVGQFAGLQKIDVNGKEQEAIRLTYKGGDTLYVSIHSLHRISKYVAKEGTAPSMDRLGSNAWQNLKKKTKTRVKQIAFDLIKLYAKRKSTRGHAFAPDTYLQTELEASFIYEDTPDQLKATQAVKEDMEAGAPMDRLVCGDVGFGKPEIAIRAAFKAAVDGKQVAVLVPTTILSLQHYNSFSARLKDFPVHVDYLNRFKSPKAVAETLRKLEKGETNIIIGTHALVGARVKFKDLGLLIIDEEQKFGVGTKDKLKTLRANVDTLTLTATPIPRTLQFSMMGARDLSLIQTPPPNRYPIQTELHTFSESLIRDAVSYEMQRGGQVFVVHNRIGNIAEVAGMISRLVPDARVVIGHGQMDGEKLEEVMTSFIEGEADVLVSTAIVESGLDIPNANTIVINDAHLFGMSDLHQLRGRVGRTNKKAFCYLLSPPLHHVSDDTRKRLQTIEQYSDLGSGLHIAMRDMDIRGAGDLLGAEQSGFINDLGFETYQKILNEALQELREEHFKELHEEEMKRANSYVSETVLETDFELLIPDEYVSSITERMALYRELDDMADQSALAAFCNRLEDRFGPIPPQVIALVDTMRLRWMARDLGLEKLVLKSGKMIGYFVSRESSPFYSSDRFGQIINFLRDQPRAANMYQREGSLRISFDGIHTLVHAVERLRALLTSGRNTVESVEQGS